MRDGLVGARRRRPRVAAALIASFALAAVLLAGGDASAGSAPAPYPFQRLDQPKLDSQLGQIARTQAANGAAAALGLARSAGLGGRTGTVRVIVAARSGASATARASVAAAGGTVVGSAGTLIEALVPPSALDPLAANAAVADVRPPLPHAAAAVDEAVHLTDADTWHTAGYGGGGVKIAIIDLGFFGYSALLGGALPSSVTTIDHCSGNLSAAPPVGTEHGTAVAELVHQMAPAAQLYLICVDSEVGLAQAEQDAINDGVKIVNHSVAWFNTSRGDGTGAAGTPDAIVADARAHGILWVNAAGNYGFDHWAGGFQPDSSNPDLNDFSAGVDHDNVVIDAGETGCAFLKWDDWPVTSEDFDLGLVRVSDGAVVASSVNDQADGPAAPVEQLCYTNPGASPVTYSFVITAYSVAGDPQLDLYYVGDNPIAYATTESVTEPASSPAALAVGAACWQTGQLEDYSSLGPTIDGRPKPDLTAPDSVSTQTYGPAVSGSAGCGASGFAGTSAAAPQVAGAAALLLQHQPSLSVSELAAALEERAEANQATEIGGVPEDEEIGHGPLALGLVNSIGTIAFDFGGTTTLTDGAAVQPFAGASPSWQPGGPIFASAGAGGLTFSTDDGDSVMTVPETTGDAEPSFSPLGNQMVAYQPSPSAIVKVNIFSGVTTTLLSSSDSYPDPQWAPDNSKIAYLKTTAGATDVWTMNPDGSDPQQLTSLGSVTAPSNAGGAIAWSPDSSEIAFVVGPSPYSIWVVNALNGTGAHAITTPSSSPLSSAFGPSWSPDGSQILFIKNGATLELMNADGSNVHPLNPHETFSSASLRTTAWSSTTVEYPEFPVNPTAIISGEPLVGSPLQAAITGWVGASLETFDYDWLRCKPANSCTVITGATDSTYTVTSADVGYQIIGQINATPHPSPSFRALFSADTDVIEPAPPVASTLPTITGSAQVGSALSVSSGGAWTGSPMFSFSWEDCRSDGGECSPIGGAGGSSYTVTGADAGSTIRVAVIGTNAGGSNVASSAASALVPGGGGGGGGGGGSGSGGGGGGGSVPDLAVALSGPAQVAVGGQATFSLAVSDVNGAQASGIHLLVTLPPGATVDATSSDRGPGCTPASGTVDCNLDFLSGALVAHVTIVLTLPTAGAATLIATVKAAQGDSSAANNTASVTVEVGSPVTTVTTTTTPAPPTSRKPASVDHIDGNAKANHLTGGSGSDVIKAGAGNDYVNGGAGNDVIYGGPGNDTLYGGPGNDTITGGPGEDRIFGGPGNDTIHAVDGFKDTIDCGTGRDVVYADKHDKVAENCEVVHRS